MPFPKPPRAAIVYEDARVYACLASFPITRGHTIVAWRQPIRDLHLLSCAEVEHLMDVVDLVRDALLKALHLEKVYLMYLDEAQHVHWHLVPRYNERGFNVLMHTPTRIRTFPFAPTLRKEVARMLPTHPELRARR